MEDDYIRLSKWDLERIVGSMGGVSLPMAGNTTSTIRGLRVLMVTTVTAFASSMMLQLMSLSSIPSGTPMMSTLTR